MDSCSISPRLVTAAERKPVLIAVGKLVKASTELEREIARDVARCRAGFRPHPETIERLRQLFILKPFPCKASTAYADPMRHFIQERITLATPRELSSRALKQSKFTEALKPD